MANPFANIFKSTSKDVSASAKGKISQAGEQLKGKATSYFDSFTQKFKDIPSSLPSNLKKSDASKPTVTSKGDIEIKPAATKQAGVAQGKSSGIKEILSKKIYGIPIIPVAGAIVGIMYLVKPKRRNKQKLI